MGTIFKQMELKPSILKEISAKVRQDVCVGKWVVSVMEDPEGRWDGGREGWRERERMGRKGGNEENIRRGRKGGREGGHRERERKGVRKEGGG